MLCVMPEIKNYNLNCFRVIKSSIPDSYLGIKPHSALQPNGQWQSLGYYCSNKTRTSDVNINFNGTHLKLLTYEQHERCLDNMSDWLEIADDRNVTVGQAGIAFGSLAQDSKYPNAIIGSPYDTSNSTLWVEASEDSNSEIFVRYISDDSDLRGVNFASAYPPTARELKLYSTWLESPTFNLNEDLKILEHYNDKDVMKEVLTEAVQNGPQQLFPLMLMHNKLRTLTQDTALRMYLELKYKDREDILEKLRLIDQKAGWKPYYVHDQDCVARIKAVPNYESLILNEQWDTLRSLVLKVHFANHTLLEEVIAHYNRGPRLSELSLFEEQNTGARLTSKIASDINGILQDPDFFNCTIAEKTTMTILNMLCTRIHFIDPEYANDDTKMCQVIHYLEATERDIQVSLTGRYDSNAYSPALIDLLITRVDALANSTLSVVNTKRLSDLKAGFNLSKAFMESNNHQAHPISEKYANALTYYCCQDIHYEKKREFIPLLQVDYTVVSEEELTSRLSYTNVQRSRYS